MFEKVLVPTDFSKHAKKVIECVGEIPGIKQVVLLSVISRSAITRVWDPVAELKEVEARLMEEKKLIAAPGIEVKVRAVSVLEGEIGNAVQRVAEEEKASLVAMGAEGKEPYTERPPGKRLSPCPALRGYPSPDHALQDARERRDGALR